MIFEKIFGKIEEEPEEEYVEIPAGTETDKKVFVRIENARDVTDVPRIQRYLREGNIVFLRIKEAKDRDLAELKRIVDRLKKTCIAMDGDIIGVDENFLVLTPNFAKIYRGVEEEKVTPA
jgi:SepF-like predicted cell division protein (DUF552 family)